MKWSFERTPEGRCEIKDGDGTSVFTSALPARGEGDDVVLGRTAFVVDAINEKLATVATAEDVGALLDASDAGEPKTKRGGKKG